MEGPRPDPLRYFGGHPPDDDQIDLILRAAWWCQGIIVEYDAPGDQWLQSGHLGVAYQNTYYHQPPLQATLVEIVYAAPRAWDPIGWTATYGVEDEIASSTNNLHLRLTRLMRAREWEAKWGHVYMSSDADLIYDALADASCSRSFRIQVEKHLVEDRASYHALWGELDVASALPVSFEEQYGRQRALIDTLPPVRRPVN